jgi:hypothetical protein
MANGSTKGPTGKTPPKGREDRLKVALKANMARRKAQAKARSQTPSAATDNEAGKPAQDE